MQTFLQRVQNYAMSMAISVIVRMFRKDGTDFAKEIGQEMQSSRTGVASSAALIVTADWAIEYPQPMPPRVHVSCSASPIRVIHPKLLALVYQRITMFFWCLDATEHIFGMLLDLLEWQRQADFSNSGSHDLDTC